jgi:predicted phage tail protein
MEREVKLYGSLAKFTGHRRLVAEINSAAEALRMLIANFPGLDRHMADRHYRVIVDNYDAALDEIHHPVAGTIQIIPVIGGAGGGVGRILLGAALIVGAFFTGGATIGFFGSTIGVGAALGGIGATLVLGGVAQLLTPTPQIGQYSSATPGGFNTTENTELDPQKSYSFSGIQNTSQQGSPVPLIYGEVFAGSVVISAGIDTDNI